MSKITTLFISLLAFQSVQAVEIEHRLALIIGNAAYRSDAALTNPVHDAQDLADALRELQFRVQLEQNLTYAEMDSAIQQFGEQLRAAPSLGFFYYAGHGMQLGAENYLIPIGGEKALFEPHYDVDKNTIKASDILTTLEKAANAVNVIILDACRDNPFASRGQSRRPIPPGLQMIDVSGSALIAFAAKPGKVALDGKSKRNSPYAASLIKQVKENPNSSLLQLFTQVRADVFKKTEGLQAPGFYSELNRDYCLASACPTDNRGVDLSALVQQVAQLWQPFLAAVIAIGVLWLGWRRRWVGALVVAFAEYRATKIEQRRQAEIKQRKQAEIERRRETQIEQRRQAEIKQRKQAEIERRRQAEIERRRQAEIERRRQAEIVHQKAEEERQKDAQRRRQAEFARPKKAEEKRQKEAKYGKLFEFETVTVNAKGQIIHRKPQQARYQTEDLGNGVTLEMVYIPGGTFMMGSPDNEGYDDEKPQHQVTVKPFFMGKYEVTQAQWQAVMGNNPSYFNGDNRPVETISWEDAVAFCQRLSKMTGKTYRLASEAEWEYAARAGTTTPFYFGETITTDLANYDGDYTYASEPKGVYRSKTTEVGIFPPNGFGLYDMHGNVWEWCADAWHDNYKGAPTDGSIWEITAQSLRLLRGGSFSNDPDFCRTALRGGYTSDDRDDNRGVRVVAVAWTF